MSDFLNFEAIYQAFEQWPVFFYFTVFIFSITIGSFLNVVVYRLPKMMERQWYYECREFLAEEVKDVPAKKIPEISLSIPRSNCPKCGHQIKAYENIPIISWLFLKGKCSGCNTAISIRYPLVELFTGIFSVIAAYVLGPTMATFFVVLLTWALVALTLIDFDHMLLPDQITLPLIWLGLLLNLSEMFVPIEQAVIGAVAGYMSLYIVFWVFKFITKKEGMGFGDFKLVAGFGAWFGWQLLPLLILMASLVGAIVGISLVAFKGHNREKAIPFGPYLAVAGWITLLWGEAIWAWYLAKLV